MTVSELATASSMAGWKAYPMGLLIDHVHQRALWMIGNPYVVFRIP
jgi:hypothetical protein